MHRPHCIKGKQCLKLLDGNKKTTKMKKEVIKSGSLEMLDLSELACVNGGKTLEEKTESGKCIGLGCKCSGERDEK